MSTYSYQVVRWPFAATASTEDIRVEEDGGAGTSTQAIGTGTSLLEGDGSGNDWCRRLSDALTAAHVAIYSNGSAVVDVSLEPTGRLSYQVTGAGTSGQDIVLALTSGVTTVDPTWLGYDGTSDVTVTTTKTTSDLVAAHQWHPGARAVWDSDDHPREVAYERRAITGRPSRVVHSAAPYHEREIEWQLVPGARMTIARAADSAYATVAGVPAGSPATWEDLYAYLLGDVGPFGDHRVYVYSSNDPAVAAQGSPYEVVLEESDPGLDGIGLDAKRDDMSSVYYDVTLSLWRLT